MAKRNRSKPKVPQSDARRSNVVHVSMDRAALRRWAAEHEDLTECDTLGVEQSAGGSSAPDQDDDEAR